MTGTGEVTGALQRIVDALRHSTAASRATVRVVGADGVPALVAESLAPGVLSMHDGPQPAITVAPTYVELERTRDLLIQPDLATDPIRPPQSLVEDYRVGAQMLAPVFAGDAMVATISVHQQDGARAWGANDIAALRAAQRAVTAALE